MEKEKCCFGKDDEREDNLKKTTTSNSLKQRLVLFRYLTDSTLCFTKVGHEDVLAEWRIAINKRLSTGSLFALSIARNRK